MTNDYYVPLNSGLLKQEQTITEIVEGRSVPRDLINSTTIEDIDSIKDDAYIYVDNNGTASRMEMKVLNTAILPVVTTEPTDAVTGQIIFKEVTK